MPALAAAIGTVGFALFHAMDILFMQMAVFMTALLLLPRLKGISLKALFGLLLLGNLGGWWIMYSSDAPQLNNWKSSMTHSVPVSGTDAKLAKFLNEQHYSTLIDERAGFRVIAAKGNVDDLVFPFKVEMKLLDKHYLDTIDQIVTLNPSQRLSVVDAIGKRFEGMYWGGREAEQDAKAEAARVKAEQKAKAAEEAQAKKDALAKAKQDALDAKAAKLKADQDAKAEAARVKAEQDAASAVNQKAAAQQADATADEQARAKAEAKVAKLKAEQDAKAEAARVKAEQKAQALADAQAKKDALAKAKQDALEAKAAKLKAAQEAEAARVKAEQEAKAIADAQAVKSEPLDPAAQAAADEAARAEAEAKIAKMKAAMDARALKQKAR